MPDGPSRAAAPQLLWTPNNATIDTARITAFLAWLRQERGIELDGYHELWQWSVADLAGFWDAVRVFFDVRFAAPAERVLGDRAMPGASWFPHSDLRPGDRLFWYTSTSWMVWNVLVSSLLTGATVVLYDGGPTHPGQDRLWRIVADQQVTVFGTSAANLHGCAKAGLSPARDHPIEALRALHSTGSPLSADGFHWAHEHVGPHVPVLSGSGGTDVATAFVGDNPLLPVRVGEISGPCLGVDVHAWDDDASRWSARSGNSS